MLPKHLPSIIFTEEVTSFEGVDQIYPADSSDPQYHNSGIEDDYGPGNIIIYRVLTNLDRRDGNPSATSASQENPSPTTGRSSTADSKISI